MKKSTVINSDISRVIAQMGHFDLLIQTSHLNKCLNTLINQ